MNGDKENFHDEIAEMAAERAFEDEQAEEMYAEMERAKPYIGEGVIFGPKSMFGLVSITSADPVYPTRCVACGKTFQLKYVAGWSYQCDDCIPF